MGFYDGSDPNAVAGEFEQFPSGEVVVTGIQDYISKDDQGIPLYKERDGRLFTMVRLRMADGTDGPPMSCSPAELVLLVIAFAGPAAINLLPTERDTVEFMLRVKQLANGEADEQKGRTPTKQTAYVGSKGYVRNLSGMELPTDQIFKFVVDDIRNLDGSTESLHFTAHEQFKQEVLNARFRIVGGIAGPTIYDGATITVLLVNPFDGSQEVDVAEGRIRVPKFRINENKSKPKDVSRIQNFVRVFAPDVEHHQWISDMTRSNYGTNETENPIVVIADYALKSNRIGIAKLMQSQKSKRNRVKLDILDLIPFENTAPLPVAPVVSRPQLEEVFKLIDDYVKQASNVSAFEPNSRILSDTGKAWAREKLSPVWDSLELPSDHRLADINETQAQALLGKLLEVFGWPKNSAPVAETPKSDF